MRRIWAFIAMGAAAALAAASPASAAVTVPLFTGTGSAVNNNAIGITQGAVKVQVTSWTSKTPGYWDNSRGHIRTTLGLWNHGVGSDYTGDESHTVDNTGRYDFILLQFNTAVALNTVTFTSGWAGYDSDATISNANVDYAAYGSYNTTNRQFWNAAAAQLRDNRTSSYTPDNAYVPGQIKVSERQVNPSLVTSNVWLIAAKIGDNDSYMDAFKVQSFTYMMPYGGAVPEPATWAMLILGMGVVGSAMRRKARVAHALA